MVYITFGQSVFITVSEIKLRLKKKKKKKKNKKKKQPTFAPSMLNCS